jgi:NTP pyrophosphatase (non-canonical NTP hydrolase)
MENFYATEGPTSQVLTEVQKERERQNKKFGEQNHDPFKWMAILGEEVGEVHRALLEAHFDGNEGYAGGSMEDYREELIQVAAVAVAQVEAFDRGKIEEWSNPKKDEKTTVSKPNLDGVKIVAFKNRFGEWVRLARLDEDKYAFVMVDTVKDHWEADRVYHSVNSAIEGELEDDPTLNIMLFKSFKEFAEEVNRPF